MSKPIFIIRFPGQIYTPEEFHKIRTDLFNDPYYNEIKNEYFILFTLDDLSGRKIKFECYNSNCTEIEFQELQEKVLNLIDNGKK